jgi:hypothetical protein
VSADRQRLLLRLEMYALQERSVSGDGNCQVRSTRLRGLELYYQPQQLQHPAAMAAAAAAVVDEDPNAS